MSRRSPFGVLGIIVIAIVGLLALGAIFGGGDWGPRHRDSSVTIVNPSTSSGQVVPSGSMGSAGTGSVIVVDSGRRGPGFFPLFPLLVFGLIVFGFVFLRRRFGRGWGPGGPGFGPGPWGGWGDPARSGEGPAGPPPAWFDRWHEQAHRSTTTATATAAPVDAPPSPSTGSTPATGAPAGTWWSQPASPASPDAPATPAPQPTPAPEAASPAKPDDGTGPQQV